MTLNYLNNTWYAGVATAWETQSMRRRANRTDDITIVRNDTKLLTIYMVCGRGGIGRRASLRG